MTLDVDSPTTPATPPSAPARKARKPRAKPVLTTGTAAAALKRPRAPRTGKVRTLRVRVDTAFGANGLEAFDLIVKREPFFWDLVHSALGARDAATQAAAEVARIETLHEAATVAMEKANARALETADILTRLSAKAALVAQLHDCDGVTAQDIADTLPERQLDIH